MNIHYNNIINDNSYITSTYDELLTEYIAYTQTFGRRQTISFSDWITKVNTKNTTKNIKIYSYNIIDKDFVSNHWWNKLYNGIHHISFAKKITIQKIDECLFIGFWRVADDINYKEELDYNQFGSNWMPLLSGNNMYIYIYNIVNYWITKPINSNNLLFPFTKDPNDKYPDDFILILIHLSGLFYILDKIRLNLDSIFSCEHLLFLVNIISVRNAILLNYINIFDKVQSIPQQDNKIYKKYETLFRKISDIANTQCTIDLLNLINIWTPFDIYCTGDWGRHELSVMQHDINGYNYSTQILNNSGGEMNTHFKWLETQIIIYSRLYMSTNLLGQNPNETKITKPDGTSTFYKVYSNVEIIRNKSLCSVADFNMCLKDKKNEILTTLIDLVKTYITNLNITPSIQKYEYVRIMIEFLNLSVTKYTDFSFLLNIIVGFVKIKYTFPNSLKYLLLKNAIAEKPLVIRFQECSPIDPIYGLQLDTITTRILNNEIKHAGDYFLDGVWWNDIVLLNLNQFTPNFSFPEDNETTTKNVTHKFSVYNSIATSTDDDYAQNNKKVGFNYLGLSLTLIYSKVTETLKEHDKKFTELLFKLDT